MRLIISALLTMLTAVAAYQAEPDAATQYLSAPMSDPIAQLQQRVDSGQLTLRYEPQGGYLKPLLRALGISPNSQTLVFSKTSLQLDLISPETPRALYFNDQCWVGFVQGGRVLELMAMDPKHGVVFYTLPQTPGKFQVKRQTYECLQCHQGAMTQGVPGHVMRSLYVRADGRPDLSMGSQLTTDSSPIENRWGGWYVTGTHGKLRHQGNVIAKGGEGQARLDLEAGANLTDLRRRIDTSPYLTPSSDIVALMVAEHQGHLQNLITKAGYLVRDGLRDEALLNAALKETGRRESTAHRIAAACEPLVEALLFSDEAPLSDKITGTTPFAREFALRGPLDGNGRSLRDLDLKTRLCRYPLSWTIYTPQFDALPDEARRYIAQRLSAILSGQDTSKPFAQLSLTDRQAILEIVRATKPGLLTAR